MPHVHDRARQEPLEPRRLLDAGAAGFAVTPDGVLFLDTGANTGTADHVEFYREGNDLVGTWRVDLGGVFHDNDAIRVPHRTVTGIRVHTNDGDDQVIAGRRRIPVTVNGGLGDDTIAGGLRGDRLLGAGGDDYLVGAGGDDYLEGGNGNDRLNGSAGDDYVAPGRGFDRVFGAGGNDTVALRQPGPDSRDFLFADIETPIAEDRSDIPPHLQAIPARVRLAAAHFSPETMELRVQMEHTRGGDRFELTPAGMRANGDLVYLLTAAIWTGPSGDPDPLETFEADIEPGPDSKRIVLVDDVTRRTLANFDLDHEKTIGRYVPPPSDR